jgi:hypothetical protein
MQFALQNRLTRCMASVLLRSAYNLSSTPQRGVK